MRIAYLSILLMPVWCSAVFHKSADTLMHIASLINNRHKGAYFRFGDGDINLANGQHELLQRANGQLQKEMQEAFMLADTGVLKTLPLHCREFGGYEPGMFGGNHEWTYAQCLELLQKVRPFWKDIDEVYAQAALHYTACYDLHTALRFLYFLSDKCFLLVGNKNIPSQVRSLLFGNCHFVPTPDQQSYTEIDRIEQECLQLLSQTNDYKVVVVAMGCSGRVLQKRLWQQCNNIFLFDFGSLMDALCGWNTRAWISLSNFEAPQFLTYLKNKVKVLYTAALIDQQFESRKTEYCYMLTILRSFGYYPYIAEAITAGPSFFDEYSSSVFYAQSNDNSLRNKGANEIRLLRKAADHFAFNDEDMIVKVTGRYYFTDDSFLKTVELHPEVDVFARRDDYGQLFTGCYAIRAKYLRRFLQSVDVAAMERQMINVELLFKNFVQQLVAESVPVMYVPLHLVANIFGTGQGNMTYW